MTEQPPKQERNAVHEDAIWRQLIRFEDRTEKNWEKQWAFMSDVFEGKREKLKLPPIKSDPNQRYASGLPSNMPAGLTKDPHSIVSGHLLNYNIPLVMKTHTPMQKYAFPATTTTHYGWIWTGDRRTAHDGSSRLHTLEKFGKQAKGKGNVLRWYGGTVESLP